MGPLQGMKVVDMTSVLMGPFAAQILATTAPTSSRSEGLEGDVDAARSDRRGMPAWADLSMPIAASARSRST